MYLIYLMAGAICLPNGSDKSDTSVSLSFLNTKLTKHPFLLCFPCSYKNLCVKNLLPSSQLILSESEIINLHLIGIWIEFEPWGIP